MRAVDYKVKNCRVCGTPFKPASANQRDCTDCAASRFGMTVDKLLAQRERYRKARIARPGTSKKQIIYRSTDDIRVEIRCHGDVTEILEHTTRNIAREKWYQGYDTNIWAAVIYVNGQKLVSNSQITKYIGPRSNKQRDRMIKHETEATA